MPPQKIDELFENNRKYNQGQLSKRAGKSYVWAWRQFKKYDDHVVVEDNRKYMLGKNIKKYIFKMEIE